MHTTACKEFYANLTVSLSKKKEVATSMVSGVNIELDNITLASIIGVPRETSIYEYIKDVLESSKYCNPLEITRKFANDELITIARRVKSTEMKPFQRRKINLPRLMMRHMGYVISVKDHELPYGDWLTMVFEAFNVPLIDKQGEEPKRYDFCEETFLTMCQLKRENGVWWLEIGRIRRRDDEDEIPAENDQNEEVAEEGQNQEFDWEAVNDEDEIQGEEVEKDVEIQEGSGSDDQFFDAQVEVEAPADEVLVVPTFLASPADSTNVQKETVVDPSIPTDSFPDSAFMSLQAEFERARADRIQADLERAQAENARLLALLQQAKAQPK
ncbi:hypothetical protein Dimus_029379 [Dionaea muscipula]